MKFLAAYFEIVGSCFSFLLHKDILPIYILPVLLALIYFAVIRKNEEKRKKFIVISVILTFITTIGYLVYCASVQPYAGLFIDTSVGIFDLIWLVCSLYHIFGLIILIILICRKKAKKTILVFGILEFLAIGLLIFETINTYPYI